MSLFDSITNHLGLEGSFNVTFVECLAPVSVTGCRSCCGKDSFCDYTKLRKSPSVVLFLCFVVVTSSCCVSSDFLG